jgi:hypothetical protein
LNPDIALGFVFSVKLQYHGASQNKIQRQILSTVRRQRESFSRSPFFTMYLPAIRRVAVNQRGAMEQLWTCSCCGHNPKTEVLDSILMDPLCCEVCSKSLKTQILIFILTNVNILLSPQIHTFRDEEMACKLDDLAAVLGGDKLTTASEAAARTGQKPARSALEIKAERTRKALVLVLMQNKRVNLSLGFCRGLAVQPLAAT